MAQISFGNQPHPLTYSYSLVMHMGFQSDTLLFISRQISAQGFIRAENVGFKKKFLQSSPYKIWSNKYLQLDQSYLLEWIQSQKKTTCLHRWLMITLCYVQIQLCLWRLTDYLYKKCLLTVKHCSCRETQNKRMKWNLIEYA